MGGIHHKKEKGQPTLTSLLCLESSPSDKAGTGAIGTILPLDTLTVGRRRLQGNCVDEDVYCSGSDDWSTPVLNTEISNSSESASVVCDESQPKAPQQ